MCRWLAYCGDPIPMAELITEPERSLLQQSRRAERTMYTVNGDGVGLGWYGGIANEPGLYRETRAAWNDENVQSLSRHVTSGLFLAHVRAVTRGAVSRVNTHPFRIGGWLFQHNGDVGGWNRVHKELDQKIGEPFYEARRGQTDSETLFALAMTLGLQQDPAAALAAMIREVEAVRRHHGIDEPFRMSVATTDGSNLWAARYASGDTAPSLYVGQGLELARHDGSVFRLPDNGTVLVSEPLDLQEDNWSEVPDRGLLHVCEGTIRISQLDVD